ncbi:MAG: hypothetical protein U0231_00510 [Nitrospiraceae bacterium]
MTTKLFTFATASAIACALTLSPAWANYEGGHGGGGYGKGGHAMGAGIMEMMMHGGAGHLIRHLLKHEKEIGLSAEQVAKLKDIQLNLDKTRIKMEADVQVAERELKALTDDEKSDLGAIEAKLKQSADLQVALRMVSIKTRREALGVLTADQRAKEKSSMRRPCSSTRAWARVLRRAATPMAAPA